MIGMFMEYISWGRKKKKIHTRDPRGHRLSTVDLSTPRALKF